MNWMKWMEGTGWNWMKIICETIPVISKNVPQPISE